VEEGADSILDDWRQGDLVLGAIELPLLSNEGEEGVVIFADAQAGVCMLTQSCDIIRDHVDKPYVQFAMLCRKAPEELAAIQRGERPRFAYVGAAAAIGLAVDLDVVATVDKESVRHWSRTPGCQSDHERRELAAALGRHRQRFAFPDRFNDESVKKVRRWLESKRRANSPFGRLFAAIIEVRVTCDDWDQPSSIAYDIYVAERPSKSDEVEWQKATATLEERAKLDGYPDPSVRIVTRDEVSASEYLASDRVYLDDLSGATA